MDILALDPWCVTRSDPRASSHGLVQHLHHAMMFPVAETVLMAIKRPPKKFGQLGHGRSKWAVEYGLCTRWTVVVEGGQLAIHQYGLRSVIGVVDLALEKEDGVRLPIYDHRVQGREMCLGCCDRLAPLLLVGRKDWLRTISSPVAESRLSDAVALPVERSPTLIEL